jgi:hypothetical protein
MKRLGGSRVTLVSDPGLARVGLVTRAEEALREGGLPFDTDTALAVLASRNVRDTGTGRG